MTTADCFATIEDRFRHPPLDWYYENPIALYGLVRMLQPATVVEVGTYVGLAACYLARALQENNAGHLYCIDNWASPDMAEGLRTGAKDPRGIWEANLEAAGVRAWATLLEGDSAEVEWPERVDFAYIDGDHSYAACKRDAERAMRLGAECIALDDSVWLAGPRAYVQQVRRDGDFDVMTFRRHGGLTLLQRRTPLPPVKFSMERAEHLNREEVSAREWEMHFVCAAKETGIDLRPWLE